MQKNILLRPATITSTTISSGTIATPTVTSATATSPNWSREKAMLRSTNRMSWFTWLSATITVVMISYALLTNYWLHIYETIDYNGLNIVNDKNDLVNYTVFGFWSVCTKTKSGSRNYDCMKTNVFKDNLKNLSDSTTNFILSTLRKSITFFLIAATLLSLGYLFLTVGHCCKNKKVFIFIAGIMFIKSGLVMLFAVILYISSLKQGLDFNAVPSNGTWSRTYRYGNSFLLYLSGFIGVEVSGVSAIFLFICYNQLDLITKRKHVKSLNGNLLLSSMPHNHFNTCNYLNSLQNVKVEPLVSRRLNGKCNVHNRNYQLDCRSMNRDITTNTISTMTDLPCDDVFNNSIGANIGTASSCHSISATINDMPQEFVTFNMNKTLNRKKVNLPNTLRKSTPV